MLTISYLNMCFFLLCIRDEPLRELEKWYACERDAWLPGVEKAQGEPEDSLGVILETAEPKNNQVRIVTWTIKEDQDVKMNMYVEVDGGFQSACFLTRICSRSNLSLNTFLSVATLPTLAHHETSCSLPAECQALWEIICLCWAYPPSSQKHQKIRLISLVSLPEAIFQNKIPTDSSSPIVTLHSEC